MAERFEGIMERLAGAKGHRRFRSWLEALIHYTVAFCEPPGGKEAIIRLLGTMLPRKEANEMAMSLAEKWILEGKVIGEKTGEKRGEKRGLRRGIKRGNSEGQAKSVLTVLRARFSPYPVPRRIVEKLSRCTDSARLTELTGLAATCASLDEFAQALG